MGAYLLGIVLFAVGIAATIGLHELGHLGVARMCGMRVRRYFIGFGPQVFSVQRGPTEYGLKALPFGGFCEIAGMTALDEVTPEEEPYAMRNKPAWQRIAVLLGGIAMNLLIGVMLVYGVAVSSGIPNPKADTTPVIAELTCVSSTLRAGEAPDCSGRGPAEAAGLRAGDRVLRVDGHRVNSFAEVRENIARRPGGTVRLEIARGESTLEIPVDIARVNRLDTAGKTQEIGAIGVIAAPIPDAVKRFGPLEGIPAALDYSAQVIRLTVVSLAKLPGTVPGVAASIFGGPRDVESPMSVVGVSRVGGELVENSLWSAFFMMLASLNFFLALFNLVPLPPFDGGHVAVVLYEKLRDALRRARGRAPGGPADYTQLLPLTYAIGAALVVLSVVFVVADVVNPIRIFG